MPAQDLSASGGQFPTNNSRVVGAVQPQTSSAEDTVDELLKRQETIAQKVTTAPNVGPPIGKIDEQGAQTVKPQEPPGPIKPAEKPEPKLFINQEPVKLDETPKVQEPVQPPTKPKEPVQTVKPAKQAEPPKETPTGPPTATPAANRNPNALLELTKADIFKLLGMSSVAETEKKKNLDEMEETIWADFVEEDLPKMLSPEEKTRFEDFLKTSPSAEKIINFFGSPPSGGLPQNFEEKYLAKTLEFKAEIAKEQIATLLESVDDPKKKEILTKAKAAADGGYWKQVEDLMVTFG